MKLPNLRVTVCLVLLGALTANLSGCFSVKPSNPLLFRASTNFQTQLVFVREPFALQKTVILVANDPRRGQAFYDFVIATPDGPPELASASGYVIKEVLIKAIQSGKVLDTHQMCFYGKLPELSVQPERAVLLQVQLPTMSSGQIIIRQLSDSQKSETLIGSIEPIECLFDKLKANASRNWHFGQQK